MAGRKISIGIVGEGMAGLTAHKELSRAGFEVLGFESAPCVGGRMSTRVKNGLAFDRGANFTVAHYKNTADYCKELGLLWQPVSFGGEHFTLRDGKLCRLTFDNVWSLLKFDALSFVSQLKLLWLFFRVGRECQGFNFFDLPSLPSKFNNQNAYDYVRKHAGQDVADYVVDAFTSMYQFHRAREISLSAMLALVSMMVNESGGFVRHHVIPGEMSGVPEGLARDLNIKLLTSVSEVSSSRGKVLVRADVDSYTFDSVVLATTADMTRKIYKNPTLPQRGFLNKVEYASTINVSFKVPVGSLNGIACVAVPFVESQIISEYTNEELKGIASDGYTLVNVGLHEKAARDLFDRTNEEIFSLVKGELLRVCPPLRGNLSVFVSPHDLARWRNAMPKFSTSLVSGSVDFWRRGQGDRGVYFAGDYTGHPWIEGAILSGKKVASLIQKKYFK